MPRTIVFQLYGKAAELAAYLVMRETEFKVSFFRHECFFELILTNELEAFIRKAYPEGAIV